MLLGVDGIDASAFIDMLCWPIPVNGKGCDIVDLTMQSADGTGISLFVVVKIKKS